MFMEQFYMSKNFLSENLGGGNKGLAKKPKQVIEQDFIFC